MTIKELFEESMKMSYTEDLQALIMFLVFEKEVLSMNDDAKELNLYFLEKHRERMNAELNAFKKKMNITYSMRVYEFKNEMGATYILARSVDQAKLIAASNGIKFNDIDICDLDQKMIYNGMEVTLKDIVKNRQPSVLGGY